MTHKLKRIFAGCGGALMIAACSTPAATQMAHAKPDPRQGEEVRNVCFSTQIRNWRSLDHHSVIIEKGVKDEYKLDLVGSCQPDDAFTSIGLISRIGGGSCLETGDKLVTDARYNDGTCLISKIYKWNKDATTAQSAAPAAS